jgi:putative replication initiation protein
MRRCAHRIRLDDETVVDCKTRDFYSCPHCAALYRGDWQAIIRDGLYSLTEPARIVFMTLTAPSFGAVHRIPSKSDTAKRSRCSCGEAHTSADSALRGVAVDPERYDYLGQVAWNRDCGALWRLTLTYLRRALPFEFDYVKVYEWQARGALHLHLILRLPPSATSDVVETIRRTCLSTTSPSKIDGEYRGWGERIDVADCGLYMPEDRGRMATSMDGVVRYVGKVLGYVGKSLLEQASRVGSTYPQALEHFRRLSYAAFVTPCSRDCPVTGCSSPRHRNIGASSHVVSASRKSEHREGWSPSGLNRTILGRRRSEYIEARKEERSAAGEKEVELPRSVNLTRYEMKALFLHQAGIAHGVVPERSSAQNA